MRAPFLTPYRNCAVAIEIVDFFLEGGGGLTLCNYRFSEVLVFIFENQRKWICIAVDWGAVYRQKWEGINVSWSFGCLINGIIIVIIGIIAHGGRLSFVSFYKKALSKSFYTERMMSSRQQTVHGWLACGGQRSLPTNCNVFHINFKIVLQIW